LAVRPYAGFILDSLGWLYHKRGNHEQAYTYLRRSIMTGDVDPVIYEHMGDICMKLKKVKEAVEAYEKSVEKARTKEMETQGERQTDRGRKQTQPRPV
jgi:tetratricopeptide (TPR) repeat protein